LFFHSALYDGDIFEGYFAELAEQEEADHRLYGFGNAFVVEQLGALDPVRHASNAALDAIEIEVASDPASVLLGGQPAWMADAAGVEQRLFERLARRLEDIDVRLTEGDVPDDEFEGLRERFSRLAYVASRFARRRAFFFDEGLTDGDVTPYESLPEFVGALAYLKGSDDRTAVDAFERATERTILGGVIASERIPTAASATQSLQVRLGEARGAVGARLEFHIDDVGQTLLLPENARLDARYDYRLPALTERFLEYFPTFLVYRPFRDRAEHLVVTLDLYELLFRLYRGFTESFGGQQRTQQLRVFKAAVKARPTAKLSIFDEERAALTVQGTLRPARHGDGTPPRMTFQ
jgi:hypothetical protein